MAPPIPPDKAPKCALPDQSKWTHKEKVRLAAEAKKVQDRRKPEDYKNYFDSSVEPLNEMARTLQLGDVFCLLALSANESGWLNVENAWLNNLFGLTAGGKDNLGFESLKQAADYWVCRYGPYVKGVKNRDDFVQGLKNAGYNTVNPDYYTKKKWDDMIFSINKRYSQCGYERYEEKGIWLLKEKG